MSISLLVAKNDLELCSFICYRMAQQCSLLYQNVVSALFLTGLVLCSCNLFAFHVVSPFSPAIIVPTSSNSMKAIEWSFTLFRVWILATNFLLLVQLFQWLDFCHFSTYFVILVVRLQRLLSTWTNQSTGCLGIYTQWNAKPMYWSWWWWLTNQSTWVDFPR